MALDEPVLGRLGLEVVLGLAELDARLLGDEGDGLAGEVGVAIEAGADGGAAEGEFVDRLERLVGAVDAPLDLLRVAAELLSEAHRRRVHEVGAADLQDAVKFFGLGGQRGPESLQRGDEIFLQCHARRDVHGGGEGVVRGLPLVDVVVRMDGVFGADLLAGQLGAAVGDDLVGVHVGRGARARLVDVDGEVLVELALVDLFGGGFDLVGEGLVDVAELAVGSGGGPFDEAVGVDDARLDGLAGNREVQYGTLGAGSIECGGGNLHLTHRVTFGSVAHCCGLLMPCR